MGKRFCRNCVSAINENRFAVLYSDNPAGRPNAPVNAIIGALILKDLFSLIDDELLESILCDVRFQFALHTTSLEEQPFSDRTFSRFRERLYRYEMETGIDLLQEEMSSLAEYFVKYLGLETKLKRMDSLMVSSSAKKMTRLEIIYTAVANVVRLIHQTGEIQYLQSLEHYLDDDDRNQVIYHRKSEEQTSRLQQVIEDALLLVSILPQAYNEFSEYQLLQRVIQEQTEEDSGGQRILKDKKNISPSSLQNPSDPDATYRFKAGKSYKGYVANVVETVDESVSIITDYAYKNNSHSDSAFCKTAIETVGSQVEPVILLVDGAYGSVENEALAEANNIELVTTALIGKTPDPIQGDFNLDEETGEIINCPKGYRPIKTVYNEATESFRANFDLETCSNCEFVDKCGAKLQKKTAVVVISKKTVSRAKQVNKMSTDEYKELSKKRNGVEGVPSVLRRGIMWTGYQCAA